VRALLFDPGGSRVPGHYGTLGVAFHLWKGVGFRD